MFRNTVSRLFDTRSLYISSDSTFKWMSSSSSDSLPEDLSISVTAEDVVASYDFLANSVLRKPENCDNSSGRQASKSIGYASWRLFALWITSSSGRSLFRRKPDFEAIPKFFKSLPQLADKLD